jgi:peptidoglycan hydrolase-like protein with peptidoglycan-binding domain
MADNSINPYNPNAVSNYIQANNTDNVVNTTIGNGSTTTTNANTLVDSFELAADPTVFQLAQATRPSAPSINDVLFKNGKLSPGMQGESIQQVRAALTQLGFPSGGEKADVYGPNLASAVKGFQTAYRLPVDGNLDKNDLGMLERARWTVPEGQTLGAFGYPRIKAPVEGYWGKGEYLEITGGFMEPSGHGSKPTTHAIFSSDPNKVQQLAPSNRNLGIDYVAYNADGKVDNNVRSWWNGQVTAVQQDAVFGGNGAEGYGRRTEIKTDLTFQVKGTDGKVRDLPVYVAYGHLASQKGGLDVGERINAGDILGQMGGAGSGGDGAYPAHVDMRVYVNDPTRGRVDISPNLLLTQAYLQNEARFPNNANQYFGR